MLFMLKVQAKMSDRLSVHVGEDGIVKHVEFK